MLTILALMAAQAMTPAQCQTLQAQIAAETDPAHKAELQAQYQQQCPAPVAQPSSGGNSPPPIRPK